MLRLIITIFLIIFISNAYSQTHHLYVSPTGNDKHEGSQEKPLKSLQAAIDKFQTVSRDAYQKVIIELADGIYPMNPVVISPRINGLTEAEVVIKAQNQGKAILTTGKNISISDFTTINDPAFRSRTQTRLRDSILAINLSDLGIRNIRQDANVFDGNGELVQLFFNKARMPLATYPSPGGEPMTMEQVLINGGGQEKPGSWSDFYKSNEVRRQLEINPPRPGVFTYRSAHEAAHQRWARAIAQNVPVWVNGYWRVMWENSTIRIGEIDTTSNKVSLSVPLKDGIGSKYHRPGGSGKEVYKVVNLLEEIDQPGEWSFDFQSQQVFFYPPSVEQNGEVMIAHDLKPIITLNYMSNITLEGLVIEGGLGNGIEIRGGSQNIVQGCIVRNIGNDGIRIEGGFRHTVKSSDLYDLGGGGIWLSGGMEDTKPRIPAKHRIINNHIHHFAKVRKVYAAGINCGFSGGGGGGHAPAVGMYIAHNLIHTTPHVGILHGSYDNVFEYNEVADWSKVSNDMGALYSYGHYPYIENTVVRYNFFHSSKEGDGIYFDHNSKNAQIYGNILFKIGTEHSGRGIPFLLKNGDKDEDRDHMKCYNNIVVASKFGYFARLIDEGNFYNNVAFDCFSEPFDLHYYDGESSEPIKNPASILLRNKIYNQTPGFENLEQFDLRLKPNAPLYKDFPSFKHIDFDKIGLFEDEFRKKVFNLQRTPNYFEGSDKKAEGYDIEDRN